MESWVGKDGFLLFWGSAEGGLSKPVLQPLSTASGEMGLPREAGKGKALT